MLLGGQIQVEALLAVEERQAVEVLVRKVVNVQEPMGKGPEGREGSVVEGDEDEEEELELERRSVRCEREWYEV